MSDSPDTTAIDARSPVEWRDALAELVNAQTDMLTWYREVHEPAGREGDVADLEDDYDVRNERVCDARSALLKVAAPDWNGLLIKLQQHAYVTAFATDDETDAAAGLLCHDLVRLAESCGKTLTLAQRSPHVGPDLSELLETSPAEP